MATKKRELKVGDWVKVRGTVGVVTGHEETEDSSFDMVPTGNVYVEWMDKEGESNNSTFKSGRLVRASAPEYVVVWTDEYSDPFTAFSNRPEADKFAARKRKTSGVCDVRIYKLTK